MPKGNKQYTSFEGGMSYTCACGKMYDGYKKSVENRIRLHTKLHPECKKSKLTRPTISRLDLNYGKTVQYNSEYFNGTDENELKKLFRGKKRNYLNKMKNSKLLE